MSEIINLYIYFIPTGSDCIASCIRWIMKSALLSAYIFVPSGYRTPRGRRMAWVI